ATGLAGTLDPVTSPCCRHYAMQDAKNEIAQEKFGKSFEECDAHERQVVGGVYGGNKRKEQMTEATGGDTHKAYSEMSQQQNQGKEDRE
ncbi:hypothetical protein QJQ45_025546, partial [Haematococcus lacustris]